MDKYRIVVTQRAFSDINECILFVNAVSNDAAQKLYEEIIKSIQSLKSFPEKYSFIEGFTIGNSKVRRMPIHNGKYILLYKVEKDFVTVYDILDSRKDNYILRL